MFASLLVDKIRNKVSNMRKESLIKENKNGAIDNAEDASSTHEAVSDAENESGKQTESDGEEDPLAIDAEPGIDPFDALQATPSSDLKAVRDVVSIPSATDDDTVPENEPEANTSEVNTDENTNENEEVDVVPSTSTGGLTNGANHSKENGVEEFFEVQEIVDHKYKGKRMKKLYLIRWQGYGPESDTWEPEDSLMCPDIVEKYLEAHPDERPPKKEVKPKREAKPKKEVKPKKPKKERVAVAPRDTPKRTVGQVSYDDGDEDDYEVDAIVGHKSIGKQNFYLVHWKGYNSKDNTWEPEKALSCQKLIEDFNNKPKRAKGKKRILARTAGRSKVVQKTSRPLPKARGSKPIKKKVVNEPTYEVEKVIDSKMIRGEKHFQIRWKGYTEKDDTWEHTSSLNCPDLIKQFEQNRKKANGPKKDRKVLATVAVNDENIDYEVEEIVDDKIRYGKKLFFVKWKGYSSAENTWEPEGSLSCPELIAKYSKTKEVATANQKDVGRRTPSKRSAVSTTDTASVVARKRGRKSVTYADDVKSGSDEDTKQTNGSANGDANGDDNDDTNVDANDDANGGSEPEWEVEKIINKRTVHDLTEYLIRWKGCKASEDTWEPEENVNSPKAIVEYEKSTAIKGRKKSKRV